MYFIGTELDAFDSLPVIDRVVVLRRYLDALAENNLRFLKNNPTTPALYEWAPKYEIKPRPFVPELMTQADIWQDIPSTMRRGTLDCKDAACWRVAELYKTYPRCDVGFHIKVQEVGDVIVYHIQVEGFRPDGQFAREDPSKLLGMPEIFTMDQLQKLMTG